MQSAPATIPAMIAVSFPAGFAPAEATLDALNRTRSPISSASPVCSANPITGTRPAHDTRCSSSKTGTARDHRSGSFTSGAFCWMAESGPRHSRFSNHRRHFNVWTRRDSSYRSTDRGLVQGSSGSSQSQPRRRQIGRPNASVYRYWPGRLERMEDLRAN